MWLEEHFGLHRKSGYLNSEVAHKGLYALKSPKYMQAFKFQNEYNVRNPSKQIEKSSSQEKMQIIWQSWRAWQQYKLIR